MPSPLISNQQILNSVLSASNSSFQVGNTDAALFRVSALGVNIADVSNSDAGDFLVSAKSGDAAQLRVSGIIDSGSISAKSGDGSQLRISAIQEGAGALMVSAKSQDGALFRVSAIQDGATALNVSAKSNDGALLRVSALNADQASFLYLTASAITTVKSAAGNLFGIVLGNPLTSAIQGWDNTVSGGTTIFKLNSNVSAQSFTFGTGIRFANGLTVSAGSVLDNITFIYL